VGMEQDSRRRIAEATREAQVHGAALVDTRREQMIYEYWQEGFSKQGVQSLLMDGVAAMFNQERGAIFPALTQGVYDVQFSTRSKTKAGEWRERTEFQVFEQGKPITYAALSGGQRRRIDVGVMLTLIKVVSKWLQVPGCLGVLVLDEVFGFLDASGAEGLSEVLREVQEQVPVVFVVSHEPQLQALFANTIVIQQDERGISRILSGGADDTAGVGARAGALGQGERGDRAGLDNGTTDADRATDTVRTVRRSSPRSIRGDERARMDGHPRRNGLLDLARGDGE